MSGKPKRGDKKVQWTVTVSPKTLIMLRKQSEKSDVPMARLVERAILELAERGWK